MGVQCHPQQQVSRCLAVGSNVLSEFTNPTHQKLQQLQSGHWRTRSSCLGLLPIFKVMEVLKLNGRYISQSNKIDNEVPAAGSRDASIQWQNAACWHRTTEVSWGEHNECILQPVFPRLYSDYLSRVQDVWFKIHLINIFMVLGVFKCLTLEMHSESAELHQGAIWHCEKC